MPKIPQRRSVKNISTQAPLDVSRSTFTPSGYGTEIEEVGTLISETANRFQKAKNLHETTIADTQANIKLKELEYEASQDQDVWNEQKYKDKINKIRLDAGNNISSPEARDVFKSRFEMDLTNADFNIRKTLRKKQQYSMRASMIENLDSLKDQYISAGSDLEQKKLKFKRDDLINNYVESGVINKEEAATLKLSLKNEWEEASIRVAIRTDATVAKEMLEAGDFEDLEEDKKDYFIEKADKKIKDNEKSAKDILEKTWADNLGGVLTNMGNTSVEDVIQMITRNEIDPKEGNKIIEFKTSKDRSKPWGQYETDKKIWLEMVRDSFSPQQDLNKFMSRINDAVSKEQMSTEEAAELTLQVQSLYETAIKNKSKPGVLEGMFGASVKAFKEFASLVSGKKTVDIMYPMVKDLFKKMKNGDVTEKNIKEHEKTIISNTTKTLYPGYNPEDLEATAKKYGMSITQVYNALEKKKGK